jgi:hypothetical protein
MPFAYASESKRNHRPQEMTVCAKAPGEHRNQR